MGCTTLQRATSARARGFTLVELLVSTAIFVTVIASVTLLFNAAIRASKQGFQNQEAYEVARGAMDILERDLSRGFTRTDLGDTFNFYGTPIGFTYVGMVPEDNTNRLNMARVTYVIYHDPLEAEFGALQTFYDETGTEENRVPTYGLLRYVEFGESDLDSYPLDWDAFIELDSPGIGTFQQAITGAAFDLAVDACNESIAFDPNLDLPEDSFCIEQLDRSLKRKVWLIMVSGGGLVQELGVEVPSAWDEDEAQRLFPPGSDFRNADPLDFIVAENIRHVFHAPGRLGDGLDNDDDEITDEPDEAVVTLPCIPQTLNVNPNCQPNGDDFPNYDPSKLGRIPFFTYTTYVEAYEPSTDRDIITPVTLRYWNDELNVFFDGIDNDGLEADGLNPGDPASVDELREVNFASPLAGIIPASVNVDFRLFYPSPYPGAPDFKERFTQRIDLIAGYRRTPPEIPDGS